MKKEIQDKSFVKIPGWVVTRLHLTGDEAIVYSIIYGHKDGFCEPISYLAAWLGKSEQSARRILRRLVEAKLLSEEVTNGKPTSYKPLTNWKPTPYKL